MKLKPMLGKGVMFACSSRRWRRSITSCCFYLFLFLTEIFFYQIEADVCSFQPARAAALAAVYNTFFSPDFFLPDLIFFEIEAIFVNVDGGL